MNDDGGEIRGNVTQPWLTIYNIQEYIGAFWKEIGKVCLTFENKETNYKQFSIFPRFCLIKVEMGTTFYFFSY